MRFRCTWLVGIALLAACASGGRQASTAGGSANRWTGSLQQTTQRSGNLEPIAQQRATGTILMSAVSTDSTRMQVRLTVSAPGMSSSTLRWALLPGRCGTAALPLIGFEQFPRLDIGGNGRGEVSGELPIRLDREASYHVNVYRGQGTQLTDVLTCGNLRPAS